MEGILKFRLPREQEDFETAVNGMKYRLKLDQMWNELFRPAFKHGYSDKNLQELFEKNSEVQKFVDLLSDKFQEILKEE